MRVKITTIFMGAVARGGDRIGGMPGKKENRNTIFGGDFGRKNDPVAQKMQQARKQAMKIVGDAWNSDQAMMDGLNDVRNKMQEYKKEIGEANAELKWIRDERSSLQEGYGVAEDSQEQQDLKLLEKEQDKQFLTKEERERLAQIHEEGLTDYQKRSLELKASGAYYEDQKAQAERGMKAANEAVSSYQREMEKSQTMIKAEKSAENILEAAMEEVRGMLWEEAKDHIDEEMEEKKEEALEKAEEEKEKEEQIEEAREKKDEKEEFAEQVADSTKLMTEADSVMEDVQREIKKILDDQKLLEEDLKGAAVDASL